MGSLHLLAAQAARLNRNAGAPPIPALFFFTDPVRTPNPIQIAQRLPRGTGVVFRHFGAADRGRVARALATTARRRGLLLLIAGDPDLATRVGAAGVHWPEARLPTHVGPGLATASAHGELGLARAARAGAAACFLGPVFATRSGAGRHPIGLFHASQLARAATLPVIALGGMSAERARRLAGRGFAGVAAVDAFSA